MIMIYTKKLLNSDWLRKECSSSVTRVQIACVVGVKRGRGRGNLGAWSRTLIPFPFPFERLPQRLECKLQMDYDRLKHKGTQQEPVRLELFQQQKFKKMAMVFCKQRFDFVSKTTIE